MKKTNNQKFFSPLKEYKQKQEIKDINKKLESNLHWRLKNSFFLDEDLINNIGVGNNTNLQ